MSDIHPELQTLKVFIRGLKDFMGHGGNRAVAESIGMKESAFSRFVNEPKRSFDAKTLMAYALMIQTRSEGILGAELTATGELGPLVFKEWKLPDGSLRFTWMPKEEA